MRKYYAIYYALVASFAASLGLILASYSAYVALATLLLYLVTRIARRTSSVTAPSNPAFLARLSIASSFDHPCSRITPGRYVAPNDRG